MTTDAFYLRSRPQCHNVLSHIAAQLAVAAQTEPWSMGSQHNDGQLRYTVITRKWDTPPGKPAP